MTVSFVAWEKPTRCHSRFRRNDIKRVMRAIPIFEINNHIDLFKVLLRIILEQLRLFWSIETSINRW
ncbi:hypothetical protein RRR_00065 [Rickettsia rickettsii str. R]|nr:hypothetical protein RRR_00065 [Rickettsia rickettsii str. R]AJG33854.1 hypothetical protein RRM_00065 [Rickettsia rickettsii str. Morgan]